MSFINPTYLWALLGLAIPIAIHIWNKKEGKTIKIGSIKLLSEEDTKQSHSLDLNELLLLFLRLSIIILVVLIMAEPLLKKESTNVPITYIIEPSLITDQALISILDSLETDSSIRLLQSGFPDYDEENSLNTNTGTPHYWQLAKDMESLHTDSIVVFSRAFANGLKGKRPTIKKNTEWVIIDDSRTQEQLIDISRKENAIETLALISDHQSLSFKKEAIPLNTSNLNDSKDSIQITFNDKQEWFAIRPVSSQNILIYHDDQYSDESRYIEAGIKAISQHLDQRIEITKTQETDNMDLSLFNAVVWLSDSPLTQTASRTLKIKLNALERNILVNGQTKNEFFLTSRLNSENIIDKHLTEHLLTWLNFDSELEGKIQSLDQRVVQKAEIIPIYKDEKSLNTFTETLSVTKWLLLLLALLSVTERIIAYLRKQ